MAKTVKLTMYYPTFNEKKNEFDYKEVTHERPMTKQERKWDTILDIFLWVWIGLVIITLTTFMVGVVINFDHLGIISVICAFVFLIGGFVLNNLVIKPRYDKAFSNSEHFGFETEILQWEQQTQEQNEIAEKWRAEHEFEELIRKAKLSANCNDIAQAAIYYANHYIKNE